MAEKNLIVIGFVGKRGCGKDACSKYIVQKYGAEEIVMSRFIGRTLNFFKLHADRKNIVWLITKIRERFGKGILARSVIREIKENKSAIYVLNGIRLKREFEILREQYGRDFILVDIACEDAVRFERIKGREKKSGYKKDELNISLAKFIKQEKHIVTEIEIPAIEKKADYVVDNSGSKENLYEKLDEIMKKII